MKVLTVLVAAMLLTACSKSLPPTGAATIQELRGQWVVINYWAQWCAPCIKEIPELNALDQRYPQVTVLGVNFDGATGEQLTAQLRELKIDFAMLTDDPSADLGLSRPTVLPTTLILNPAGELTEVLVGPQTLESLTSVTGQSDSTADS